MYKTNAERLGRHFLSDHGTHVGSFASSDMGNVAQRMPVIHPSIGLDCGDAANQRPEFTPYCAASTGDKGVLDGALAIAWTVVDLATSAQQRHRLLETSKLSR
ncbi:MAG: hypothetical protein ACR2IK_07495 [Chloroflexota bacterium]